VFDIGVTKLAIVGGIALIVIGPEKLPAVAKTLGTLLGRARRYVADVKEEVNRSMDLEELRKMRDTVESAAQAVEKSKPQPTPDASRKKDAEFEKGPRSRHPTASWYAAWFPQGSFPNCDA
jgi:sec-independent protein translocase protein TatB